MRSLPVILTLLLVNLALPVSWASAQEDAAGKVCVTPTREIYDLASERAEALAGRHRDPAKEWNSAFLSAVQKCERGDALIIAREALTLAARHCDLDKPIALATEQGPTALCTFVGGARDTR